MKVNLSDINVKINQDSFRKGRQRQKGESIVLRKHTSVSNNEELKDKMKERSKRDPQAN